MVAGGRLLSIKPRFRSQRSSRTPLENYFNPRIPDYVLSRCPKPFLSVVSGTELAGVVHALNVRGPAPWLVRNGAMAKARCIPDGIAQPRCETTIAVGLS